MHIESNYVFYVSMWFNNYGFTGKANFSKETPLNV